MSTGRSAITRARNPARSSSRRASRGRRPTQVLEYFTHDWSDPREMYRNAEEQISDEEFKQGFVVSSDPDHHVERLREIEELGATIVCVQITGTDPFGTLRTYGERVLPSLRAKSNV